MLDQSQNSKRPLLKVGKVRFRRNLTLLSFCTFHACYQCNFRGVGGPMGPPHAPAACPLSMLCQPLHGCLRFIQGTACLSGLKYALRGALSARCLEVASWAAKMSLQLCIHSASMISTILTAVLTNHQTPDTHVLVCNAACVKADKLSFKVEPQSPRI